MSDDGAFSGALMLSQQLSMYRTIDALDRTRYNNLAVDNALLNRELDDLVARYNYLVRQYNALYHRADEVTREADRRLAELQRECDRLRQGNKEKDIEIRFLRGTLHDLFPDRYPPV